MAGLARLGVSAVATNDDRRTTTDERRTTTRHDERRTTNDDQTRQTTNNKQQTTSAACYDSPAAYELVIDGRKLIGSAQRRQNGALLQHGAIPFTPHADRLCALLHRPPVGLATRMATLGDVLDRDPSFEEVADALVAGCAEAWHVAFERGAWTTEELALADSLRAQYADETWTWRR